MLEKDQKIFLTGFMGVGKSTVTRHLANFLRYDRVDLDALVEKQEGRSVAEIIKSDGVDSFRAIESSVLGRVVAQPGQAVVALGGGAWTIEGNRRLIKDAGHVTVWLESTFEHCWINIRASRRERPLAKDKDVARSLFEERQKFYCLADLHFRMRPGLTSYHVARQIAEEVFGVE
jgi:shikimate kinase